MKILDLNNDVAVTTATVNSSTADNLVRGSFSMTLVDSKLGTPDLGAVLFDVARERHRQDSKWGEQNHPDFYQVKDLNTGENLGPMPLPQRFNYYGIQNEDDAKSDCERAFKNGKGNWCHILLEEISEAVGTTSEEKLEEELIQNAAVIVAWVQCIRRRRTANE